MKRFTVLDTALDCHIQGQGQPLLLVHGFPLDHTMWEHQIRGLSDRYRVIAPDLRGFGGSLRGSAPLTMPQFAADLSDLVQQVVGNRPVAFCGLSMGGYIAWEFYRSYREQVSHLILCDTKAEKDVSSTARARRLMARSVQKNGMSELTQSMSRRLVSTAWQQAQPDAFQALQDCIQRAQPQSVAAALLAMAGRADATELLATIKCPTLVMVGAQEVITTVDAMRSVASAIKEAKCVTIPHAGHLAPLENPVSVNRAVREFLG